MDEIKIGSLVEYKLHEQAIPAKDGIVIRLFINWNKCSCVELVSASGCCLFGGIEQVKLIRQLTDEELLTHEFQRIREIALERIV